MITVKSACCHRSLEKAGFYAGIYTLILYTVLVIVGVLNLNIKDDVDLNSNVTTVTTSESAISFGLCLCLIVFSGTSVVCSVFLIIGVCVESKKLLIPWITSISITTLVDVVGYLYFMSTQHFPSHHTVIALSLCDSFICVLNIYLLVVVVSLYQELSDRDSTTGATPQEHSNKVCVIVTEKASSIKSASNSGESGSASNLTTRRNSSLVCGNQLCKSEGGSSDDPSHMSVVSIDQNELDVVTNK